MRLEPRPWRGTISTSRPYKADWPFPYRDGLAIATRPGQKLRVRFRGRIFGVWGPGDASGATIAVAIDGANRGTKDTYWEFAEEAPMVPTGWRIFSRDLSPGDHVADIELLAQGNSRSRGTRASLGYILVEQQAR